MPIQYRLDAESDMPYRIRPSPLPSMTALRAFESAARHRSFSRAAEELHTSQSAVSRHIAELERRVSVRLFDRSGRNVDLTEAGNLYYRAVVAGLERITEGAVAAAQRSENVRVVIACTYAVSHLFVLPRFDALRRMLGENVCIRVLTCDTEVLGRLNGADADLVLSCQVRTDNPEDRVVVFREAVVPVCAPRYAAQHAKTLNRPVADWGALTFLEFTHPHQVWSNWEDWFATHGVPAKAPRYLSFESYVYLLEASVAGHGIAIGWRHLVDRYLEEGNLITIVDEFVEYGRPCYAALSERGRHRPVALRCLDFFREVERERE